MASEGTVKSRDGTRDHAVLFSRLTLKFDRLLHSVLFVGPLAVSAIPLLTPIFFAILSIVSIGIAWGRGAHWQSLLPRTPAIAACLMLAAYLFVNVTWSADPTTGLRKAAVYAILVFMSFAAAQAVATLEKQTLRRAGLFFAAGAFVGALFVLAELLTHGLMSSAAWNQIPILHPNSAWQLEIRKGRVIAMEDLGLLNHNVSLVIFNLWPGLLALSGLKGVIRTIAMVVFFVTITAAVMISYHDASKVALLASSVVVMAMWRWPLYVVRALAVIWCVSFVLVIPASLVAYQSGLHLVTWLPDGLRQRVIIWEYTAEQVPRHLLLGAGIESTPALNQQLKAAATPEQPDGFIHPRILGSHAHNIYLQAWFELGAVGALLFAIAGASVVMLIHSLPALTQPFAAGAFATFALVAAFSFSAWQMWFMCAAAWLPLTLRVCTAK